MWDLPRPGLKPVSPALAGRFSTTAPPGKPNLYPTFDLNAHSASFNQQFQCLTILCWEIFPRSLWVISQITKIHFTGYINYQEFFFFFFIAIKQLNLNIKNMQKKTWQWNICPHIFLSGVLNWVIGMDMYTPMCIKLMTNKNLQYKTNKQTKKTTNTKLSLVYLYGNMLI